MDLEVRWAGREPRRIGRLTLHEGRYHQIKRMFHRIGNRVTALHRVSVGGVVLSEYLKAGEWRVLTTEEIKSALSTTHQKR